MTSQEHAIRFSFSTTIRAALRQRFGKIPSNAVVAREFNLRSHGAKTVSQESVRRWLLGTSLPEYSHLQVLLKWLNIDSNQLFQAEHLPQHGPPNARHPGDELLLPEISRWNQRLRQLSPKQRQPLIDVIEQLLAMNVGKTERIYMDFSGFVSSTPAARAVPAGHESIPRKPEGSSATYEKISDYSPH